ncbi:outer membrane beta-barrel protein [bacterium]|nr:outer membrane beta-barrel protein [candidate division CSSED10-310 bacterium]
MRHTMIGLSLFALFLIPVSVSAVDHTFGVGFHYFYTLDDISSEVDDALGDAFHKDGLAINFSYRFKFNDHFGIIAEVQTYPDGYLDAESSISPRILATLGQTFYIAGGVGWHRVEWENLTEDLHDADEWTDSFYLLRAGIEFPLLTQHLFLDINANYEFNEWNDIDEFDSDIVTFGAAVKFTL